MENPAKIFRTSVEYLSKIVRISAILLRTIGCVHKRFFSFMHLVSLSNIFRTSIEHLSNICRKSRVYRLYYSVPSGACISVFFAFMHLVYRKSIENPFKIDRTSIEHRIKIDRRYIEHRPHINRCLSKIYRNL